MLKINNICAIEFMPPSQVIRLAERMYFFYFLNTGTIMLIKKQIVLYNIKTVKGAIVLFT